jgi:hypothetical protein
MSATTTETVTIPTQGDGTALGRVEKEVTVESGFQSATADKGTVRAVCPDPDNVAHAIIYVTGLTPESGSPVSVTLTYTGE